MSDLEWAARLEAGIGSACSLSGLATDTRSGALPWAISTWDSCYDIPDLVSVTRQAASWTASGLAGPFWVRMPQTCIRGRQGKRGEEGGWRMEAGGVQGEGKGNAEAGGEQAEWWHGDRTDVAL